MVEEIQEDLTANDFGQILWGHWLEIGDIGRHWGNWAEIGDLGRHFYVTCEIVKLLGRQLADNGQTFGRLVHMSYHSSRHVSTLFFSQKRD